MLGLLLVGRLLVGLGVSRTALLVGAGWAGWAGSCWVGCWLGWAVRLVSTQTGLAIMRSCFSGSFFLRRICDKRRFPLRAWPPRGQGEQEGSSSKRKKTPSPRGHQVSKTTCGKAAACQIKQMGLRSRVECSDSREGAWRVRLGARDRLVCTSLKHGLALTWWKDPCSFHPPFPPPRQPRAEDRHAQTPTCCSHGSVWSSNSLVTL